MDIDPPTPVAALLATRHLPRVLADHVHTHDNGERFFAFADPTVIDDYLTRPESDPTIRGAVALLGAYAHLQACEYGDSAEIREHTERAESLLQEAEDHGIDPGQTHALWFYAKRNWDVAEDAADVEEFIATHGTSPGEVLEGTLNEAWQRYGDGDRAGAVELLYEVARTRPEGVFSPYFELVSIAWCRLLHDAISYDGPAAARQVWQEARATLPSRFPYPPHALLLVEALVGRGVPDIVQTLVTERCASKGVVGLSLAEEQAVAAIRAEISAVNGVLNLKPAASGG